MLSHLLFEKYLKDGKLTGKTKWANVAISGSDGKIITVYPSSNKPACK